MALFDSRRARHFCWLAVILLSGCPGPTPPNGNDSPDDGSVAVVPKGTSCAAVSIACYDEFAQQPGKIICVRPESRWPRTELTWRLADPLSTLDPSVQLDVLDRAFAQWANVSALSFQRRDSADADITLRFASGPHGDEFAFDGAGANLGHAFFPGSDLPGAIHLCSAEDWGVGGEGRFDLYTVVLHEIGHALGLEHSLDPDAVMAPSYSGIVEGLTQDDIDAIQRLYGNTDGSLPPIDERGEEMEAFCADAGNFTALDDPDSDVDGVPDSYEVFVLGSKPFQPDTDDDGVEDFTEVMIDRTDLRDRAEFIFRPGGATCTSDDDCPVIAACLGGRCLPRGAFCVTDERCPAGSVCVQGRCVQRVTRCESDGDCPSGEVCVAGRCIVPSDPCIADADCETGMVCVQGVCRPELDDSCSADADCESGSVCILGMCRPELGGSCSADVDCETGFICFEGSCRVEMGASCATDADCGPDRTCREGTCRLPDADGGNPLTTAEVLHRGYEHLLAGPLADPNNGFIPNPGYNVTDVALSDDGVKVWFVLFNEFAPMGQPQILLFSIHTDGSNVLESPLNAAHLRGLPQIVTDGDGTLCVGDSGFDSDIVFAARPGEPTEFILDTLIAGTGSLRGNMRLTDSGDRLFFVELGGNRGFYVVNVVPDATPTRIAQLADINFNGVTPRAFGPFDISSEGEPWLIRGDYLVGSTLTFALVLGRSSVDFSFQATPDEIREPTFVSLSDDGSVLGYCQGANLLGSCFVQHADDTARLEITDDATQVGGLVLADDASRVYARTSTPGGISYGFFQEPPTGRRWSTGSQRFSGFPSAVYFNPELSDDGTILAAAVSQGLYVLHDGADAPAGFPFIEGITYRFDDTLDLLVVRAKVTAPNGLERIYVLPLHDGLEPTRPGGPAAEQNPFFSIRSGGGVNLSTVLDPVPGEPDVYRIFIPLNGRRALLNASFTLRVVAVDGLGARTVFADFAPVP